MPRSTSPVIESATTARQVDSEPAEPRRRLCGATFALGHLTATRNRLRFTPA